ncbi:hypothetical protein BH23VER1_BH23VER1_01740 [soil metagenome]
MMPPATSASPSPAEPRPSPPPRESTRAAEPARGGQVAVLLVEDNPGDARLVHEYLTDGTTSLRCRVTRASSLEEAFAALEAKRFDVALLDLDLPDSQGMETFTAFHRRADHLAIIVLSGHADDALALQIVQKGAQDHLSKDMLDANGIARAIRYAIERRHIVQQLRDTQMQLIQAEKMESIGRLAAGVAHEVKNPLARIQLGLDYIRSGVDPHDPNLPIIFERMESAVQRADSIVREMVNFSSDRQFDFRVLSLGPVVRNALMLVDHELIRNTIGIDVSIAPDLAPIRADAAKLEQVLINLLLNAVQAMSEKRGPGHLTLTATNAQYEAQVPQPARDDRTGRGLRRGDPVVVLTIDDTGPGIPQDKIAAIFDPFMTTKPTGVGTGLGLTIVRKILDLHGGRITLENRQPTGGHAPPSGARATITLPAAHERTPAKTAP